MSVMGNAAKIRTLEEIGRAYRLVFPERYTEALRIVREARDQVLNEQAVSRDGRLQWSMRIPTELFIFIRRWIEDFGQDPNDLVLLSQLWPDLRVGQDRPRQLFVPATARKE